MFKVMSTSPTFGKYSDKPLEIIRDKGCELRLLPGKGGKLSQESIDFLPEVDAMIVGIEKIDKEAIDKAEKCRIIAKHGVGVDNIDVDYATKRGILVTNVPAANSDAVADMALTLMLALSRGLVQSDKNVHSGVWKPYVGVELAGKTLGIIGTGQIGRKVCKRAKGGFDMNVVAYDLYPNTAWAAENNIKYVTIVGAYALNKRVFDALVAVCFGLVGYLCGKTEIATPPILLGLILGNIVEINFRRAMTIFRGDYTGFLTNPIALGFLVVAVLSFAWPALSKGFKSLKNKFKRPDEAKQPD